MNVIAQIVTALSKVKSRIFCIKGETCMAIDINPTSQRWKEICEIEDENTRSRALRRYVFELEKQVHSYEAEISNLRKENKGIKEGILSTKFIQDEIEKAREDEWRMYNTDWSGMQEGF